MPLMETLIPRHVQIIYEINRRFLEQVKAKGVIQPDRIRRAGIDGAHDRLAARGARALSDRSHVSAERVEDLEADVGGGGEVGGGDRCGHGRRHY